MLEEIPKVYKGMKLLECYGNYALYEGKYYKECFTYHELGINTKQIKVKYPKLPACL